jgi:hypothetical protein
LRSPLLLKGVALGGVLFTCGVLLIGLCLWTAEQTVTSKVARVDPRPVEDLFRVPEVSLEDPFPQGMSPVDAKLRLSNLVQRIRNENRVKQDQFLIAHMEHRKQLRGLPFVMGDACRMESGKARSFQTNVEAVRTSLDFVSATDNHQATFWNTYLSSTNGEGTKSDAGVAALTQMLGPERKSLRASLVQKLALSSTSATSIVLAKAAIFDAEPDVRNAAIKALKNRPKDEYSDVLMSGIRYPLVMVAKRAAMAMILLDRKDMLPGLAEFLGESAPADLAETVVNNQPVCTVREVVRVNHHRNCLLCHAPAETRSPGEVPGVLPIPGMPFPQRPSEAYGQAIDTGDPMVRADTTYLRQDFSVLMPVANAAPWPDKQRFDFLVRTRVVEGQELAALKQKMQQRPADYLSENHLAALRVLRDLSGQDAAPTPAAWQRVLGAQP